MILDALRRSTLLAHEDASTLEALVDEGELRPLRRYATVGGGRFANGGLAVLVRGKPGFVVGHELDTAAATPSFRVLISGAELWVAPRDAELDRDEADELLDEAAIAQSLLG